jgi:type VI secretion system protein VasL
MSPVIYLDDDRFTVNAVSKHLAAHPSMVILKHEVQRKVTPFSGSIDWALVTQHAIELGRDVGVDLEVAIYYWVGSIKVTGLIGLGNGLELLHVVLTLYPNDAERNIKSYESLLNWANKQAIKALENLRSTYEVLRELYRIEHLCERINHLIRHQHPQLVVDYQTLGFAVFQHIDVIETRYQLACKREGIETRIVEHEPKPEPRHAVPLLLAFCTGLTTAGLLGWIGLHWY